MLSQRHIICMHPYRGPHGGLVQSRSLCCSPVSLHACICYGAYNEIGCVWLTLLKMSTLLVTYIEGSLLTARKIASSSAKASMTWRSSTSPSRYPSFGSFPDVRSLQ